MEANKVNVRIFGQEYVLTGDKSREHMIRVAAYVDTKMHEVASGFRNGTQVALAVLSAVNIADEYFSVMDRIQESKHANEQMEGDIHRFEQLWEESKKSLADHKEESRRVYEEKEQLAERMHQLELELSETIHRKDEALRAALAEKEKEMEALLEEALSKESPESGEPAREPGGADGEGDRYRDLENTIFDLQMENIQLKSEVEKLRGLSE